MKPSKKKTAKKKNPIVSKLIDLKYRINDHYKAVGGKIDTKTDKSWVMNQISDLRNGIVLGKEEMNYANGLWKRYDPSRMNNWESSREV